MKVKVSKDDIAHLCLELSLLLHAGVSTGDALTLLAEEDGYGGLVSTLAEHVDEGLPLSAALRESGAFPAYVCGMVEAGEKTGRTEEALSALSRYYEDRIRMERRIRSALTYPAIMLVLMLAVIGVLLVKVLPVFESVYASLGGSMTGLAGGLLSLGRGLEKALPVLLAVLAVLAAFAAAVALSASLRARLISLWQQSRGDKGVFRMLNDARLAQVMAMGMAGGLHPEETVTLASGLLDGGPRERCRNCLSRLEGGEDMNAALIASGLLPPRSCRLLALGQRSGAGDVTMEHIAQSLTEDSETALDALTGRVEPALVLVCSLLVGLILLSVMLPLMNIMAAIG